jgi:hypothetical protein
MDQGNLIYGLLRQWQEAHDWRTSELIEATQGALARLCREARPDEQFMKEEER